MDMKTAEILCKITAGFYRDQCASFSQTRQGAWPGWERCLRAVCGTPAGGQDGQPAFGGRGSRPFPNRGAAPGAPNGKRSLSVLDLACGNLRFAAFLASALPNSALGVYAVDACDGLVPAAEGVRYQRLDILGALLSGKRLEDEIAAPACDLGVSFGFMHHVPLPAHREAVLAALVAHTRPGGHVAVSFWQFLKSEELRARAEAVHRAALQELGLPGLDAGDYLLGWQNTAGQYRYCHSFSEEEIDRLVASVAGRATLIDRFASDGRTGDLNTYVVLQVH